MPNYSISYNASYSRHYTTINCCEINEKTDAIISKTESRNFNFSNLPYTNVTVTFALPIYIVHEYILAMGVYFKRSISAPELIILYSDPESNERTNKQIEQLAQNYCSNFFSFYIELNKIKSINLNAIIQAVISQSEANIKLHRISYRHQYLGFNAKFALNYNLQIENYNEYIDIKLLNIVNVKKSMLKFIDQLNTIINYDQISRENIIKMLTTLNYNPKSTIIQNNITDIINANKFATIEDDFIDFYRNMAWDDKFQEFSNTIRNTIIKNDKLESKNLNIRGVQFIIKDRISFNLPPLIENYISLYDSQLKLCYALLHYYNSYETFTSAIALVKLRTLSFT